MIDNMLTEVQHFQALTRPQAPTPLAHAPAPAAAPAGAYGWQLSLGWSRRGIALSYLRRPDPLAWGREATATPRRRVLLVVGAALLIGLCAVQSRAVLPDETSGAHLVMAIPAAQPLATAKPQPAAPVQRVVSRPRPGPVTVGAAKPALLAAAAKPAIAAKPVALTLDKAVARAAATGEVQEWWTPDGARAFAVSGSPTGTTGRGCQTVRVLLRYPDGRNEVSQHPTCAH
jgi:hypothetical protein